MRRVKDQTGAAATEFALVAPLFFMLVMGMITGGYAYDVKNGLSHASREGVRYAATYAIEDTTGVPNAWLDRIATVAERSAGGRLAPGSGGREICVAYVGFRPSLSSTQDWTRKRVVNGGGVTYTAGSAASPGTWCYDDGRGTDGKERRVQVVTRRQANLNAVLFHMNLPLSSEGVARFEPVNR